MSFTTTWNKNEPTSLARFVLPDLREWQIALPESAVDILGRPGGRRELARSIYQSLSDAGIQYAHEAGNADDRVQIIRAPKEILGGPKKGTCLDLAALFAAQCLSVDLLPVIAVTRTHAFVLVSLEVGPGDVDAYSRTRGELFTAGEVRDGAALADLVDIGAYVAVEVTGFSKVESLDESSLLGAGRVDGLLPFEVAENAARQRLNQADDPFEFALDIAWAHSEGMVPQLVSLEHPVYVGDLTTTQTADGVRLERTGNLGPPQRRAPRRLQSVSIVGRASEQALLTSVEPGQLVGLIGEPGIGKSALLKWFGTQGSPTFPDATIAMRYHDGDHLDLIQELFEECFLADRRNATTADIKQHLGSLSGRLLIDDLDGLQRSKVESLQDALTTWGIAVTTTDVESRAIGRMQEMEPLSTAEAVELFESIAGEIDEEAERVSLSNALDGVRRLPGPLVNLAEDTSRGKHTVSSAIAHLVDTGTVRPVSATTARGDVAGVIRAADPAYVPLDVLLDLVEQSRSLTAAQIQELQDARLVRPGSPRYTWTGDELPRGAVAAPDIEAQRQLVDAVDQWAAQGQVPDRFISERGIILRAIELAEADGRHDVVLRLAAASEPCLSVGARWGAWEQVLAAAQRSAIATNDLSRQAWATHQLGSRALGLGDHEFARSSLQWAHETRTTLGESRAAELSLHNLNLLPPVPPVDAGEPDPDPTPEPGSTTTPGDGGRLRWFRRHPWITGIGAATIGFIVFSIVWCAAGNCDPDDPLPPDVTPTATPTPEPPPTSTPTVTPGVVDPPDPIEPVVFECSVSNSRIDLGDEIEVVVFFEPADLALDVVIEGVGSATQVDTSGMVVLVPNEPGPYEVEARWVTTDSTGSVACGTLSVDEVTDPPPATDPKVTCSREPAGRLAVEQPFLLTATWEPAEVGLDLIFDHDDGYTEPGDSQNRSSGFFLEPGTYQPSVRWSGPTGDDVVPCGPPVTVEPNRPVDLDVSCSVSPDKLEPGEFFTISTSYAPASERVTVAVGHGDGFVEGVNASGQATGYFEDEAIYKPTATFTSTTQVITISCGEVYVGAGEPPDVGPEVFTCQASSSEVEVGEKIVLETAYEPGDLDLIIDYRGDEVSEFGPDNTVSYETAGEFTPSARWSTEEGPGELALCGTVTVSGGPPVAADCINFDNVALGTRFGPEFGDGKFAFVSELDTTVTIGPLNLGEGESQFNWAQILDTTIPGGSGLKLWLNHATAEIEVPGGTAGWTVLYRQSEGPINLVVNGAQEAIAFPSMQTLDAGAVDGYSVIVKPLSDIEGQLSIIGNGITSLRIGGGGLAIDKLCPVIAS